MRVYFWALSSVLGSSWLALCQDHSVLTTVASGCIWESGSYLVIFKAIWDCCPRNWGVTLACQLSPSPERTELGSISSAVPRVRQSSGWAGKGMWRSWLKGSVVTGLPGSLSLWSAGERSPPRALTRASWPRSKGQHCPRGADTGSKRGSDFPERWVNRQAGGPPPRSWPPLRVAHYQAPILLPKQSQFLRTMFSEAVTTKSAILISHSIGLRQKSFSDHPLNRISFVSHHCSQI